MGLTLEFHTPGLSERDLKKLRSLSLIIGVLLTIVILSPVLVGADSGGELTDLFQTSAFSGSWEVFSKFNWLGKILNFIISAFCLIGMVMIAFRLILTLLYKSNEALFDKVYDLKQHGKGQKFFGFGSMGREVFQGNYGVGLDAAVGFLLSLLPDIKSYSDYNPEKMMFNLSEDDTLTTYILKVSLPTIMALFFFSIGFNGTLLQGFGNVAYAMSTGAKRLVEIDLASGVNKIMGAGSYYQFSYNTKDQFEKFQKNIATGIYNKVLLKMSDLSTGSMQSVGSSIQSWVNQNITTGALDGCRVNSGTERKVSDDHSAAKNYTYSIYINSSAETGTVAKGSVHKVVSLGSFGINAGSGANQVHVIIQKKADADETQYFDMKGSDTKTNKSVNQEFKNN